MFITRKVSLPICLYGITLVGRFGRPNYFFREIPKSILELKFLEHLVVMVVVVVGGRFLPIETMKGQTRAEPVVISSLFSFNASPIIAILQCC